VLPGFQFRLRDLYELPELEELALDELYRGYALLKYQAAIAEAAAEAKRAYVEAQRADTEAQRADAEAAARRQAEVRMQAMAAELAQLRRQSS
jgi:hypothetical protein